MTRRPGSAEARGVAEVPSAIPPLVLGLGNLLLGDDGVGLRLLEELRDGAMPGVADPVDFVDGGTQGLALLGLLSGRPSVLLLDAVCRGAPPGTVHVLDLDEALDLAATHGGTAHEGGCGGLLAIARLTGDLPLRAKVVGVEPRRVETGIGLSEDVARAVPTAVERAREVLAEMLREAGPPSPPRPPADAGPPAGVSSVAMHELGIAQEVHRLCRRHVAGVAGARLSSVKLAVGELSALEPELLRFAWEAVTADGPDAGAALEIRWCPCRQVCDTCGDVAERQPGSWLRRCPRCGGALRLDGGRELDLLQLTYETPDGEGDADDGTHAPGPHRQEAP